MSQPEKPAPEKFAYSIQELADSLSLSYMTVRNAIADGELVAKKRGRRILVLPEEAKRWRDSFADA